MGLAGVKKSSRIGIDPRNTKWINNENGVGHKLLAAQGWAPGQGLGDSMSGRTVNIKTVYKDDTAGIGCTAQHAQEWSGLSAFNDIFARINSGDPAVDLSDPGLKNRDKVVYVESENKRVGLDVRFVKGETFTSELSKVKFLESLGLGVAAKPQHTAKEQKKLRKLQKAVRREARAAKKAEKLLQKGSKSARKTQTVSPRSEETSSAEEEEEGGSEAVRIPPPSRSHGRFASRAKYQRAKLGSRMDAAQLAEVLGLKA